ncbi:MAG: hypothetical protein V4579_13465 [Pseudomonadota bacterium]
MVNDSQAAAAGRRYGVFVFLIGKGGAGARGAKVRFLVPLFVSFAVLILDLLGLFDPLNLRLVDLVQRWSAVSPASVVIVETTAKGPESWSGVLTALRAAGAKRVVFTFDPFGAAPPSDVNGLLIGEAARRSMDGQWRYENAAGPPRPAVIIPPTDSGLHRTQLGAVEIGGRKTPTIEAAAVGGEAPDRFLIDYTQARSLPRLSAERVAQGQLASGMLEGKIAVVAPPDGPGEPRFATPPSPESPTARPVDLHAAAIATLEAGEAVRVVGPLSGAMIVLAMSLTAVQLLTQVTRQSAPRSVAAMTTVTLVVGVAVLWAVERLLPVSEVVSAQLLTAALIWRHGQLAREARLSDFVRRAAVGAEGGGLERQESWPAFAMSAARLLGIDRQLLLRRQLDGGFEQLAAIDLSEADLPGDADARRLLLYSADRTARSVVVAGEPELSIASLAPNEPHGGYWLHTPPLNGSEEAVRALRDRMTELLLLDRSPKKAEVVRPRLETSVMRTVERLERRGALLGGAIASISSGVALFDAAGLLIQSNAGMDELMRAAELEPGRTTMVDLVSAFAGIENTHASRMLRHVLLTRSAVRLPVARELVGRRWRLRVAVPVGESLPATGALICELVDVTDVVRLAELQRNLAGHLDTVLRNDLEAVQLAARLAQDPRLAEAQRARVLDRLNAGVIRARDRLLSVGPFLTTATANRQLDAYPVDPLAPVHAALVSISADAARSGVELITALPTLAAPVIAEPEALRELVRAIVGLIIRDSRPGDCVSVKMGELVGETVLHLDGGSFGLPEPRLRALVDGDAGPASEFGAIAGGARALRGWGGSLTVAGGTARGYVFTLTFQKLR